MANKKFKNMKKWNKRERK